MLISNLVIQVVIALVHLLQSKAPLILHMDVGVELPLCGLHKLTYTSINYALNSFRPLHYTEDSLLTVYNKHTKNTDI